MGGRRGERGERGSTQGERETWPGRRSEIGSTASTTTDCVLEAGLGGRIEKEDEDTVGVRVKSVGKQINYRRSRQCPYAQSRMLRLCLRTPPMAAALRLANCLCIRR